MSDAAWPRKLHVRSLNHLARSHSLTYVASRLLANSIHPSALEEWTSLYIARKCQTHRRQVYWKHSLFKGIDADGNYEYRKCVIGSPTTQLTEVWLLDRLSRESAFSLPPCVYSYGLSGPKSSHAFKYFYNGYRNRENAIADAAIGMPDAQVLVFDLKRFYPSVNIARLKSRFSDRIAKSSLSKDETETAVQCVEELTSIRNETSLPIGPPLSHLLANVFLSEFDLTLSDKFPGKYFRYVDDVAIVVPKSDVDSVKLFFEQITAKEGLQIHPGKFDVVGGSDWKGLTHRRHTSGAEDFGHLLSEIRRYLAHKPDRFEKLRSDFQSEGFTLPFSRLRSVATTSKSYRQYLLSKILRWAYGQRIPSRSELVHHARDIRRQLLSNLDQALNEPELTMAGMPRRWHVQNLRNLINRSLYLLPDESKSALLKRVPEYDELQPTKAVLAALVTGDASALANYPGPTVAAFCELWSESRSHQPTFDWTSKPAREERDSVSVLALYGLCSPPEEWINGLRENTSRVMVKLSARSLPAIRSFDDFSYIDEVESLFLKPTINFDEILSTRFDEGEDIVLPALSLGGDQYLS